MEFEQLRASLNNNAQEKPTLYMTLCIIQSLIYDVEDEAGEDIQNCEVGDETMPTKLLWLCNTILDIYDSKKDDMVRSRQRLDDAVKKLEQVKQNLDALDEVSGKLEAVRNSLKEKEDALSVAKANAENYEALCEACRAAEEKLEKLSSFDMAGQQQRLAELQADALCAENAQKGLLQQLQEAETQRKDAVRQKERIINEITKISGEKQEVQEACLKKTAQKNSYLAEKQKAEAELIDLEHELSTLTQTLGELQNQVFEYETDKIPKQKNALSEKRDQVAELESRQQTLACQEQTLAEKQTALSQKIEKAEKELEEKQKLFEVLTADYSEKDKEIKELEQRLDEMKGKTDTEKHATYKRQLEEATENLRRLQTECASMVSDLEKQKTLLEEKDSEKKRLNGLKNRADEVEKTLDDALRELAQIDTPAFDSRLKSMESRLGQLTSVRKNLMESVELVNHALGKAGEDMPQLRELEETMDSMQRGLKGMQKALRECASCVNLEEQSL